LLILGELTTRGLYLVDLPGDFAHPKNTQKKLAKFFFLFFTVSILFPKFFLLFPFCFQFFLLFFIGAVFKSTSF